MRHLKFSYTYLVAVVILAFTSCTGHDTPIPEKDTTNPSIY